MKIVLSITLFFTCTFISHAQAVRKYSNEFMKIGVGARGIGLGNTAVAAIDDITAAYYNPAGLTQLNSNFEIGLMHNEYFGGIAKYDYGAIAIPMLQKKQVLAFSFLRLGVDNIANTLNLVNVDGTVDYNKVTLFNVADMAFLASYAKKLGKDDKWSIGGSAKIIHRSYGGFSYAWGFGLDVGAQYRNKNLKLGIMAQDITSTFNAWAFNFTEDQKQTFRNTGNEIPTSSLEITTPTLRIGAAYLFQVKQDKLSIEPSLEFISHFDGRRNVLIRTYPMSFDLSAGLEFNIFKVFYLRAGIYNIQQATNDSGQYYTSVQPNIGAGLKFKPVTIDYTYSNLGSTQTSGIGLYSHVISLNIHLKRKEEKAPNEAIAPK